MDAVRVLIVDDARPIVCVLRRVFEQAGFIVCTANHGQEALDLMMAHRFDVLITDIRMPKMDGRALWEELTSSGAGLPRCVFVVTSLTGDVDRTWVDKYPSISIVEKPVGPRHLLRLVMRRLESEAEHDRADGCKQNRRAA